MPQCVTLLEYNILASYLGKNTQPWFLYGADLSAERRAEIMAKFYEKGADGKYCNVGWPNYVRGILSDEEIAEVERCDEACFRWSVRRQRIAEELKRSDADVISL